MYGNSGPFCSHKQKISRWCFSWRKPDLCRLSRSVRGVCQRRIKFAHAWATWGWLLSQETKRTTLSLTFCFSQHRHSWEAPTQPVCLAMSANIVCKGWLCSRWAYPSSLNTCAGHTVTKQKWYQVLSTGISNQLETVSANYLNSS